MDKIKFFVPGRPRPQGSMKFINRGGRSVPIQNQKLEHWRSSVTMYAQEAMGGLAIDGGVSLTLIFSFTRPKNHYRTGKYAHLLKDSSPDRMLKAPDVDKLIRAVLDSLTGVVFTDDCEVDRVRVVKQWGPREGVEITVRGVSYAVQKG
jgi:Holliday junction resolvase RusA-like endonuclease